jgi:dihydroorotate dehydrogenase electron transfer subunit
VADRREPAPGIVVIGLDAPKLAPAVQPGQFLMAITAGASAATALGIYEAEGRRVSLLVLRCGSRTDRLAELGPGDELDVLAPLGNGFSLERIAGETAIIAGGVGLASVYLPARALRERGLPVTLYYGARTAAALVDAELFAALGCAIRSATVDGSAGVRGFVTDALRAAPALPGAVLACGPTPMLRAVAAWALESRVPAQLSLEETFACGVGACWGCVVPLDPASAQAPHFPPDAASARPFVNARVCREGPVFWAHELRW